MNSRETDITTLYVAFFNRVPDADGLQYWHNSHLSLEEISQSFFKQDETIALYGAHLDTATFLDVAYLNLFGRSPDDAGAAYWKAQLDDGILPRGEIILALVNGAKGDDTVVLEHKTEVAQYALGHGLINGDYGLDGVTADPLSVEEATTGVDDAVDAGAPDNGGGGGGTAPTPFTTTAEAEADGLHVTSNEEATAGLYDATNTLIGATTNLTANVAGIVTVAAQGAMTETNIKVENATGVTNTLNKVTLGTAVADTFDGVLTDEDIFYGFDGDDSININQTGAGSDTVFGGGGQDTIHVGDQLDTNDVIDGGAAVDTLIVKGTLTDSIFSGVSNMEALVFHEGVVNPEGANATLSTDFFAHNTWQQIVGTSLDDIIDLSQAPVLGGAPAPGTALVGGDGDDQLTAGRYTAFYGGDGDDTLISIGEGAWDMAGEGGSDVFVIADDPFAIHGAYIMDFEIGEKIDFTPQEADGNHTPNALTPADFDNTLATALNEGDVLTTLVNVYRGPGPGNFSDVYLDVNADGFFFEGDDIHITVDSSSPLVPLDFMI